MPPTDGVRAPVVVPNDGPSGLRAVAVTGVGVGLALALALALDECVAHARPSATPAIPVWVPSGLALYVSGLMGLRTAVHGVYCIYEMLWGCNVGLVLAISALSLRRIFLLELALVIVSADQMCWYIDLVSFVLTRKCPVGVLHYLTYPENRSVPKRLFATHHVFFMPLCLYWIGRFHPEGVLVALQDAWIFPCSCVLTGYLALYCRIWTPFQVKERRNTKKNDLVIYLNINGAYEFWRDIPIRFLHAFNHAPPWIYLLYLATVGNVVTNGLAFTLLKLLLGFNPF